MAGRRVAGGTLVLDGEGLSKPVTATIAQRAGELLGIIGLSGHRCAIDAVVAATVLDLERPVVLLSSDLDDMNRLVEEPERPKAQRIAAVHV
jgi:hypothetical protein